MVKLSLRHYLVISFAVAAFALMGEAVTALCRGDSLRPVEQNTTNALVIAPSRRTLH